MNFTTFEFLYVVLDQIISILYMYIQLTVSVCIYVCVCVCVCVGVGVSLACYDCPMYAPGGEEGEGPPARTCMGQS